MGNNQKEAIELKKGGKPQNAEADSSSRDRSEMAQRVGNDVEIADESASSDMVELDSAMIEELTGGASGELDTDMVQRFIGTVINDRYEIEEVIGRGGMGVVFKARHQTLDRPVVIKVLRPSKVDSDLARKRFEREAKRLCLLDHPNVVTIYDFGYHKRLGYLVMEHVDGITLSTFLKRNGPLNFAQFAPLAAGVLRGLSAAHEAGIVHRDIKASNAMLLLKDNRIERIKLLDFGLAKLVTGSEDLTKKSELIGSMSAMAPERILGHEGDERVDIYAMGIMAYHLLTGDKPFKGDDVQVLYAHVHEEPPALRDMLPEGSKLPDTVVDFIGLCLAKDPEERPRDAAEALEWLYSTIDNRSVFRLDDHPMSVPEGDERPEDSRSSSKIVFEEGTPSWVHKRETGKYKAADAGNADTEEDSGDAAASKVKPVALAMGGIAALAIIGAAAFLMSGPSDEAAEAQTDNNSVKAAATAPEKPTSKIDGVMEQIELAINEQRYGAAGEMLGSIEDKLSSRPELLSQAADFRASIKKGQALGAAQRYEKQLEIAKAVDAYRRVVNIDPRDTKAQEKLSDLEASALLVIEPDVEATVFVDGEEMGTTPFKKLVAAEKVDIVLKADGYKDWSKTVELPGGKEHELSATLEKPANRPQRRVRRPKPKPTNSGSGGGLGGMGGGDDSESLNDDSLMQME